MIEFIRLPFRFMCLIGNPMKKLPRSFLGWLLNPNPRVTNPEKIQRSRLLSAILLVLIVLGVTILAIVIVHDPEDAQEPEVQGAIILLVIVASMYVANRMGYNRYAAGGVIMPSAIVFAYIAFSSAGKSIFLAFLMIPILLTAIFFPLRWTTFISVSILLMVLVLLSFQDQVSESSPYWTLRNMWFFLMIATGLVLTFMWHLGNLEEIRQRELQRINEELERKVAELERFTYTVSHELKVPIVTIKGYLGSIERDLHEGKIEKAQQDFPRVLRATDNMHNTLLDLLELSRVGRVVNPTENVSVSEIVREALEAVDGRLRSNEITINVEPDLPFVYGDRQRLREVFENLIDNASKYSGDQKSLLIEVGMRKGNDRVFFVRDNGMGIEPKYQAKVFGLFEKLDPSSEGTGVGLALTKRIIESHGGKIWVESEGLGKGSTFYFTIPTTGKTN